MTWPASLAEMIRDEFASAQRRARGVIDRVGEEVGPVPLRVPVEEVSTKRRIVKQRRSGECTNRMA